MHAMKELIQMKSAVLFIIALFAMGTGHQVSAQQVWTLRQCIDHAIAHNVSVQQTANAAKQSEVEVNSAKWARLPNLNASAGQSWNWGRTQTAIKDENSGNYSTVYVNTSSHGTNFGLNTQVPLFTGFQIPNQYALAKLNLQAAVADLGKAKEDLSIRVTQQYLQVLFCKELHEVALQQLTLSQEQERRIARLAQLGKASVAEAAEAKSRVAQDELQVVQTRNDRQLALLDLCQLIELESPDGFDLTTPADTLTIQPLSSPDDIFQTALLQKPAVQAAQFRLESSRRNIKVAQSGFYPQLNLNGSLGTNYYSTINRSFDQQMNDNFSKYIGLSLSVPLFNRFSTRNRVRNARLQYEHNELQLGQVKKDLYKEIQQAWYNATAAESKYKSSQTATIAGKEAFLLTSKKYESGKANSVEYNEAKLNHLKAQSNELQAKYDYLFRTKILDFYQGIEISL